MTQSDSGAIVSSALRKLGKRSHSLSSLMTHDLSFAWLPAPRPRGPGDTLEGHRQGWLCPSLLRVGGGCHPPPVWSRSGCLASSHSPTLPLLWPTLPPLGYCSSFGPGCLCLQPTHSSQRDISNTAGSRWNLSCLCTGNCEIPASHVLLHSSLYVSILNHQQG